MRQFAGILCLLTATFTAFSTAIPIVDKGAGASGTQARAAVTFYDRVAIGLCWGSATAVLLIAAMFLLFWGRKRAR